MNPQHQFREDGYARLREQMVEQQIRPRGVRDPRLLEAMLRVPRHEFLAPEFRLQAYEDHPVPIGEGQTISQPYIHAAMLDALQLSAGDSVLEVGTGSGYQTALLAELAMRVVSIERHASLARSAAAVLRNLGYANAQVEVGDGTEGYPAGAPYDAIVVSAAAPEIPRKLAEQLAEGGRMIVPVGDREQQQLLLVRRCGGSLQQSALDPCRFVPLIGREGFTPGR